MNYKEGLIQPKISRRQINRLRKQQHREGTLDPNRLWYVGAGRPPLIPTEILVDRAAMLDTQGKTIDAKTVRVFIDKYHNKGIQQKGFVPVLSKKVIETSKRNYTALLASKKYFSVSRKAITKTQTRKISENSLRSVATYIVVVAATYYIPTKSKIPDGLLLLRIEGLSIANTVTVGNNCPGFVLF